jgi:hypothetical protein
LKVTSTPSASVDLSHYPNHDHFTLHVGMRKHLLQTHCAETRAAAADSCNLLGLITRDRRTHFVEAVELLADSPILLRQTSSRRPAAARPAPLTVVESGTNASDADMGFERFVKRF